MNLLRSDRRYRRPSRLLQIGGAALLLAAAALALAVGGLRDTRLGRHALQQEGYVWQRRWTPAVTASMTQSTDFLQGWRVLVAQADPSGELLEFHSASALASTPEVAPGAARLRAVVRIDGSRPAGSLLELIPRLQALWSRIDDRRWQGLEIDYDCPTRALGDYTRFVRALRSALPAKAALSITALPAWMRSGLLAPLLASVDEPVLQLHSVMDPQHGLFDPELAREWVQRFARQNPGPFWIALPDYGSRVAWGDQGRNLSVVSEQGAGSDLTEARELEVSPALLAGWLSTERANAPAGLQGIVWFRLPLEGDRRVWSMSTLRAVSLGLPLQGRRDLVLERDPEGAQRIVLVNAGAIDLPLPSEVRAPACKAADAMGGYQFVHAAGHIAFVRRDPGMLRAGHRAVVGWSRCDLLSEDVRIED